MERSTFKTTILTAKSAIKRKIPQSIYLISLKISRKIGNSFFLKRGIRETRFPIGPVAPILVNSIPKSGTNLLFNIMSAIPGSRHAGWQSDMSEASEKFDDQERFSFVKERIKDLRPGFIYMGHIPFSPEIAGWLRRKGIRHFFIYRDPRDVTVSLYHYIEKCHKMSLKGLWSEHYLYDLYEAMDDDAERLLATIVGVGEGRTRYKLSSISVPNIKLTYKVYKGWLTDCNTLALRFEDLVDRTCEYDKTMTIIRNILCTVGIPWNEALARFILSQGTNPVNSPTFRRGKSGSWKEEYTAQHIQAFKALGEDFLENFGYAWD